MYRSYESIRLQNYFTRTALSNDRKKMIFKFRTRMSDFGENYKRGGDQAYCPMCGDHPDKQELSYLCKVIQNRVNIKGSFDVTYGENVTIETVELLEKIMEIREMSKTKDKQQPLSAHVSLGSTPSTAQDLS